MAIVDLPLSFLADTLLLPVTLSVAGKRTQRQAPDPRQVALEGLQALSSRLEGNLSGASGEAPYVVGRVAPIDLVARAPLFHLWSSLPDDLRARSTTQVDTLLGVAFRRRRGEPETLIQLIDVRLKRLVYRKTHPGFMSSTEIVEFVAALPRR